MVIKLGKKRYYSVEELSQILPITKLTIRAYLREGRIQGRKIGKLWYVQKDKLEQFLDGKG
ncbi:unnamed protein product [marine sediment metagenome]|uniref:Helix-turn-helix domain-containing protein n=1 Tax=marine sediment metagenome TaxID=412755 RepID=X1M4A5_9ZZZZ